MPASSCRRRVSSTSGGSSRAQPVRLADEVGERGGRVGEDERAQPGRVRERVLLAQEPAPGLAEDVVAVGDPERADEVVQLPDEQVDRPEVGAAVGVVGAAAVAELVVVDDGPAVGEIGEREEVVVGRAWTAVKNDERCGRRRVAGPQLPRHAVPGLRVLAGEREGHGALARIHRRDSTPDGVVHIFHGFHSRLRPSRRQSRVERP